MKERGVRIPNILRDLPPRTRLLLAAVFIMGVALVAGFALVVATIIARALLLLT